MPAVQTSNEEDRLVDNVFTPADTGISTTSNNIRDTDESASDESTTDASVRSYEKVRLGVIGL